MNILSLNLIENDENDNVNLNIRETTVIPEEKKLKIYLIKTYLI